jgi:hypothetical protein
VAFGPGSEAGEKESVQISIKAGNYLGGDNWHNFEVWEVGVHLFR